MLAVGIVGACVRVCVCVCVCVKGRGGDTNYIIMRVCVHVCVREREGRGYELHDYDLRPNICMSE